MDDYDLEEGSSVVEGLSSGDDDNKKLREVNKGHLLNY